MLRWTSRSPNFVVQNGFAMLARSRANAKGLRSLSLVLLLALTCMPLLAQFSSGVEGTVTDPSGAAVTDADVSVIELNTGVPQKAKTNDSGFFRVQRLPAGTYRIEVKSPGFNSW